MSDTVADFGAFVSISSGGDDTFQTPDGRVVVTTEGITFSGEGKRRRLPLAAIAEFDFRTVPPEWEQFFDDLVGIKFDTGNGEVLATVGAKTSVADRFVTVLLKLLLTELTVHLRQRVPGQDGDGEVGFSAETAVTFHPKSERIQFSADGTTAIDIPTVVSISDDESDPRAIEVVHFSPAGRVQTVMIPESGRESQFLCHYLEFRRALNDSTGPVRFLYVGENRLVLNTLLKGLNRRNWTFEAGQVADIEEALSALESTQSIDCCYAELQYFDGTIADLADRLDELGYAVPLISVCRNADDVNGDVPVDVFDTVSIDAESTSEAALIRTLERAAVAVRLDTEQLATGTQS